MFAAIRMFDGPCNAQGGFFGWRRIKRRLVSMAVAWLFLGAVTGIHIGWRLNEGVLPIVSNAIAGMTVFSLIGVLMSFFADRAEESIIGGLCGMLVGIATSTWEGAGEPGYAINLCLIAGALIGATGWPWVYIIVKVVSWRRARGNIRPQAGV